MYKKKKLFITFEGIEGSGKTFQSKKLFNKIKSLKLPAIYTREPGGSPSAEAIRKILLTGNKKKFDEITDTLLYLAARNEHFKKILKPAIEKKKIIICDRFVDSTMAYQVYGKKVDKALVNFIHKKILNNTVPDITFILKINLKRAQKRVNKRKFRNRYDKFSMNYYKKVQTGFLKIAKTNSKRYIVLDTSKDTKTAEIRIFNEFNYRINK